MNQFSCVFVRKNGFSSSIKSLTFETIVCRYCKQNFDFSITILHKDLDSAIISKFYLRINSFDFYFFIINRNNDQNFFFVYDKTQINLYTEQ